MQIINPSEMYSEKTECYGCGNITTNISGMCDNCGGSQAESRSEAKSKHVYTLGEAYIEIEEKELGRRIS